MKFQSTFTALVKVRQLLTNRVLRAREVISRDRKGKYSTIFLIGIIIFSFLAPYLAPYEPYQQQTNSEGLKSLEGPSMDHFLGTTLYGYDIFSQLLIGARATIFVGLSAAAIAIILGTTVGLIAGYFGGIIDDILMRTVDVVYGIPILPFALALLMILNRSIFSIILIIGFLYWRNPARVIRGEVLSIKEKEFVQNAKTTGASDIRIIYRQLLPNILPLSLLYGAFATGYAIIMAASIAFLGFGDPTRPSWGRMIFEAWSVNAIISQPLWAAAPGILIAMTVASVYFMGQSYEEIANPQLRSEK